MDKKTFYFVKFFSKNYVKENKEQFIADYPTAKTFVGSNFVRFESLNDCKEMFYVEASTVKEANAKWLANKSKLND